MLVELGCTVVGVCRFAVGERCTWGDKEVVVWQICLGVGAVWLNIAECWFCRIVCFGCYTGFGRDL